MSKIILTIGVFVLSCLSCAVDNPVEKALEIVASRIAYYDARAELLTGRDPAALEFQRQQSESPTIMTSSMGLGAILGLLSGTTNPLDLIRESNRSFRHQWIEVDRKLRNICFGRGNIRDLDQYKQLGRKRPSFKITSIAYSLLPPYPYGSAGFLHTHV